MSLDVTFYAGLHHTPTGHVVLGREVLTLEQARDVHRRLGVALARLDAVLAANTREADAA